jgi:thiamine biosynthesis protein ThiI
MKSQANGTPLVIVHYDEIALKGKNRADFERQLVRNLNDMLKARALPLRARNARGRIFIERREEGGAMPENWRDTLRAALSLFPGVAYFGFTEVAEKTMEALEALAPVFAERVTGRTFRVTARRADKRFALTSTEIERAFAAAIFRAAPDGSLRAAMRGFEREVQVEVLEEAIVAYVKEPGIGGLAVGSSGRAVPLLSAGFDSPVATFLMMKRGVKAHPVHFHSMPLVSDESLEAAKDLARRLSDIQGRLTLALVPVLPIQEHIREHAPERLRIVLLRRSFMRLACAYAREIGALALITGESVGQVASQTLENMRAIDAAATLPVLRPLCGMNKREIIDLARMIGTERTSARPCDDTCSLFLPRRPETKAKLDAVLAAEERLALAPLEEEALADRELAHFHFGAERD